MVTEAIVIGGRIVVVFVTTKKERSRNSRSRTGVYGAVRIR
jgi:hypothetical protein